MVYFRENACHWKTITFTTLPLLVRDRLFGVFVPTLFTTDHLDGGHSFIRNPESRPVADNFALSNHSSTGLSLFRGHRVSHSRHLHHQGCFTRGHVLIFCTSRSGLQGGTLLIHGLRRLLGSNSRPPRWRKHSYRQRDGNTP